MIKRHFFDDVHDTVEGALGSFGATLNVKTHERGCKVWFGDETKEHYEAQLVRVSGDIVLEVGFHCEHRDRATNLATIKRLTTATTWRNELGDEPVAGDFIGNKTWQRVSEVWDFDDTPDLAIDVGLRLAEYVVAIEALRHGPRRLRKTKA
jgi:hypothetical protein